MTDKQQGNPELDSLKKKAEALSPPPAVEASIAGEPSPAEKKAAADQAKEEAKKAEREKGIENCTRQVQQVLKPVQAIATGWNLQDAEIEMLAESYGLFIYEEWGDLADAPAWVGAAISTAMVFGPRLAMRMPVRAPQVEPAAPRPNLNKGDDNQEYNPNAAQ